MGVLSLSLRCPKLMLVYKPLGSPYNSDLQYTLYILGEQKIVFILHDNFMIMIILDGKNVVCNNFSIIIKNVFLTCIIIKKNILDHPEVREGG